MSDTRVIAVANQKGGAGKTTVTVNLAVALGEAGKRVLVVDVDPQSDATNMLGVDPADVERTLYDVLTGACELPEATLANRAPGVDLAVGHERMADVELTLAAQMMRERYLADALAGHTDAYDVVLIDCPPNLGLLTVNALFAAGEVLIVVSMIDRNAYKGAMALLETIAQLRAKGVPIEVAGVLRNVVERTRQTYNALNNALLADAALPLLAAEIPMRAEFQNAGTAGQPLLLRSPDHIGAHALRKAAAELLANKPLQKAA
jgi:chromosome partitioning protein